MDLAAQARLELVRRENRRQRFSFAEFSEHKRRECGWSNREWYAEEVEKRRALVTYEQDTQAHAFVISGDLPLRVPARAGAPGVPRLLKWFADNEPRYRFFSVKFLREKLFASDPVAQEALQFAIDEGILETYEVPNPKNPSWPVTACRLNRNHPVAGEVLADDRKAPRA